MTLATVQLLVDLADDLTFATDLTAYWKQDPGFDFPTLGRNEDIGLAQPATMRLTLTNADGRFSPQNAASPLFNTWHPYHHAKVIVTFNAVACPIFYGIIKEIEVDPAIVGQTCELMLWDLMYVLSRTDIRCPLMTGYTGPIIHRLIDYAESGEIITNPRFDELQALGGYTIIPFTTTTLTRMTTAPILEGVAALKVEVPAAEQSGVRYTTTGQNGVKVRGVAYVMAESTADEGLAFIQLSTNLGNTATSADVAIKAQRWTRLEIDGTFAGGSSSQFLNVRRQTAGGATAFRVGAFHMTPFVSAIPRLVDEGQSILDNYSYPRGKALAAIQAVTENELGALFYIDGSGNAVFEDKAHRWVSPHTVPQATFDEKGVLAYSESGDDRIKEVVLDFPRYVEGAVTTLWQLDRVPVTIEALGSVTFEVDYGGGVGKNVILPVAGTDYTAVNDGGGSESANVLVLEWNDWGKGAEVTLQNQQAYPVHLTALGVRGTPVRVASDRTPARATGANGPAIAAVLSHNFALNGRETSVQAWANYLANRYDDQQARIGLRLVAPFPNAPTTGDLPQILGGKVSDRVTVTNNNLAFSTKVNSDFYINRISRRFSGLEMVCVWELVPVEPSYFIIGTSTIGGGAVIAP